jgi:hypothetical protein
MDFDQLDQGFGPEVVKCHDFVVARPLDPDHAILGIHFDGDIVEPVDALAEIGGNAVDSRYTLNLVDVHFQAARAEPAMAEGRQFHGSSPSGRGAEWAAMRERTSAS